MRISDQVEIIERWGRTFSPEEFIFWIGAHEGVLMTSEKRQTRLFREDMQQLDAVLFSASTAVVMPVRPNCQLSLGRDNEVTMHKRGT